MKQITERSQELEWMDLGPSFYTPQEYCDCLYKLDRIGRWLGGDAATFQALKQLSFSPTSILDVGCGGGLFTLRMGARYPNAKVVGVDISKEAIAFAREQQSKIKPIPANVKFLIPSSPQLDLKSKYDVVTATLMCHHLTDQDLVSFIQSAYKIANHAVILNDLHRHPLASMGFAAAVPLFFSNRLIWHDGLLSIRRSFTRKDWIALLKAAGIKENQYIIQWHWAFRWVIKITKNE